MHGETAATRRLREQAENALAASQSRKVVEPILERLVRSAAPGSDAAVFAHRGLAEYRLEDHPWRALLHLRHVLAARPDDDVAHAMSGLAHALSGHYRSAVAAYRDACRSAPENPWYQHNLGHLLDVALDRPARALGHLRVAYEALGDEEPEVAGSLVSCLARLGPRAFAEALDVLAVSLEAHPKHAGLAQLAKAMGGVPSKPRPAPARSAPLSRPRSAARSPSAPAPAGEYARGPAANGPRRAPEDAVLATLRARLGAQTRSFHDACRVWREYDTRVGAPGRGRRPSPEVLAAAVNYLVFRKHARPITLVAIARDYGVSPRAVAQRSEDIERVLEL